MVSLKLVWATCICGVLFILTLNSRWQKDFFTYSTIRSSSMDLDEKFITYMPHSGLHNQRIALINAMVLAKQLNRTLLMPEVNVGKANYWRDSKRLELQLSRCTRGKQTTQPKDTAPVACGSYRRYVPTTVSSIFDLSSLQNLGIRVTQRLHMGLDYFEHYFGTQPSDMLYIRDQSRFSYRIYDSRSNTDDMQGYEQRIDLEDLKNRQERFMVFGSLFSSYRLALEQPEWVWLWEYLFSEISFHHPTVLQQTLDIVGRLGGPGQFVSLHLRQGDGVFRAVMDQTVQNVREALAQPEGGSTPDDGQQPPVTSGQSASFLLDIDAPSERLTECLQLQATSDLSPHLKLIYMATDAPDPRRTLHYLYAEFPCLFSLSDFPDVITNTLSATALSPFTEDQLPSRLGPLLFPLIDAEVASHGSHFVGTRKSTFSKYIMYRNRRFHAYYS
ncbi:hypothetical protein DM01DRAFT_354931 [Hesseltinella vesiculosa]|uniref:O-fucosyltransferase family protein n=1 Tax=Hesseltinella vesiculosa TaxID=101127 RepID=A0A1X2GDN8_9FUNG|nr:hypothetical protein DM01DRAFT_354931 [Hesseltinella vesiculosa]